MFLLHKAFQLPALSKQLATLSGTSVANELILGPSWGKGGERGHGRLYNFYSRDKSVELF